MYIIRSESAYLMPVLFYQYNWMRNPEGTTKYIQATLSPPPPLFSPSKFSLDGYIVLVFPQNTNLIFYTIYTTNFAIIQ